MRRIPCSRRHVKGPAPRSQLPPAPPPQATGGIAQWVVFALDAGRYALPLASVERIVRAAQITPLPQSPSVILGALDIEGRVLPVFSLRQRLGLPDRPIGPDDQFVIARTAQRTVALVIDTAQGIVERPAAHVVDAARLTGPHAHIQGVIPLEDGMLLIQDLEKLLSPEESQQLDAALKQERPRAR